MCSVMIKGSCIGVKKRVLTLRKSLITHTKRSALEKVTLKVLILLSFFIYLNFINDVFSFSLLSVYRYEFQIWTRTFPNCGRKTCLPWYSQKRYSNLNFFFNFISFIILVRVIK